MKSQSKVPYFYYSSERTLEFGIDNRGNGNKGQSSGSGKSKNQGKVKIRDSLGFGNLGAQNMMF